MGAYSGLPEPGGLYDEWCWRQYSTTSVHGGASALAAEGDRCLDVSGGAATAGAAVVARACSSSASQRWTVQSDGQVIGLGGLCLTIDARGTSATIAACTGAPGQTWTLLDNGQLRGAGASCLTLEDDLVTLRASPCEAQQLGERLAPSTAQRWLASPVASVDDAGAPAPRDAGVDDAGAPAPRDAGVDAGIASARDAGVDSGIDAGRDSGIDAGIDAGRGAGIDAGTDAGIDAGRDAGPPPPIDAGSDARVGAAIDAGQDGGARDAGTTESDGGHLYVVAHPDDDLLFVNPDIERAILAGLAVRTIYVTSGDAGRDASYWLEREDGVRSAYAAMAGAADAWSCSTRSYAGATAELCTLSARPSVSLLFLRLPDGRVASL